MSKPADFVILGQFASAFGVKGWIKVYSHTEPITNIAAYRPWHVRVKNNWTPIALDQIQPHGKTLIAHIIGIDTPEAAAAYTNLEIAVPRSQLPPLETGDYYWHDLIGLDVIDQHNQLLGKIDHLFETGANDVMVIKNDNGDILIPYIFDRVILNIDLANKVMRVDWELID